VDAPLGQGKRQKLIAHGRSSPSTPNLAVAIQPDRARKQGVRNLIVDGIAELQIAGIEVAHDHVGRAVAVEIAET
jgi:hypothetical protein